MGNKKERRYKLYDKKTRIPCLKCDKLFWSTNTSCHRLCDTCNRENARQVYRECRIMTFDHGQSHMEIRSP